MPTRRDHDAESSDGAMRGDSHRKNTHAIPPFLETRVRGGGSRDSAPLSPVRRFEILACSYAKNAPLTGDGAARSSRRQPTAFLSSATIRASSAAVSCVSANATGHTCPSSSFALSLKPIVAYRVLNFFASWKWQTTLPSLA